MLLAAVLQTLIDQDGLDSFEGQWPSQVLGEKEENSATGSSGDAWLKVGKDVWDSWTPEAVLTLYTDLGGPRLDNPTTLDLWLSAVSGEVTRYWEMQQTSLSRPIMASLVERGANPLRALQLVSKSGS